MQRFKNSGRWVVALLIWLAILFAWPIVFDTQSTMIKTATTMKEKSQLTHPQNEMVPTAGPAKLIQRPVADLEQVYGQPIKQIDNGAETMRWLFHADSQQYLELTVDQQTNRVEQIILLGQDQSISPFKYHQTLNQVTRKMTLGANFEVKLHEQVFQIELNEQQQKEYPLIAFKNGSYAILVMVDNQLSTVIYLDANSLLQTDLYRVISMTPIPVSDTEVTDAPQNQQTILQQYVQTQRLNHQRSLLTVEELAIEPTLLQQFKNQPGRWLTKQGQQRQQHKQVITDNGYLTTHDLKKELWQVLGLSTTSHIFMWPNQLSTKQLVLNRQNTLEAVIKQKDLKTMRIVTANGSTILVLE